jgi:hypothetical protein
MVNITITNNDIGNVILKDAEFRDELLVFAGAGTVLEGTILARKAVADAVTPAAGSNTGDGTVTLATVAAGQVVPIVGAYVLTVTTAVTNGGILNLVDPNGTLVASDLIMTAGAGASTVFDAAGLEFTVTDAGTDFIVGDSFTLTVAADGKLVPFATDGAGGAQLPKAIVTFDVVAAGAGNEPIRAMVSGIVRKQRLIIDADGDGSNITDEILDLIRDFSLISIDVQELNILDNQ